LRMHVRRNGGQDFAQRQDSRAPKIVANSDAPETVHYPRRDTLAKFILVD